MPLTALLAAALSLSSPSDYRFTKCIWGDGYFQGRGVGPDAETNSLMRLEDVMFLNEAYCERAFTVKYSSRNYSQSQSLYDLGLYGDNYPTNGSLSLSRPPRFSVPHNTSLHNALAFTATTGDYTRGPCSDFTLDDAVYDCGTNDTFEVNGTNTWAGIMGDGYQVGTNFVTLIDLFPTNGTQHANGPRIIEALYRNLENNKIGMMKASVSFEGYENRVATSVCPDVDYSGESEWEYLHTDVFGRTTTNRFTYSTGIVVTPTEPVTHLVRSPFSQTPMRYYEWKETEANLKQVGLPNSYDERSPNPRTWGCHVQGGFVNRYANGRGSPWGVECTCYAERDEQLFFAITNGTTVTYDGIEAWAVVKGRAVAYNDVTGWMHAGKYEYELLHPTNYFVSVASVSADAEFDSSRACVKWSIDPWECGVRQAWERFGLDAFVAEYPIDRDPETYVGTLTFLPGDTTCTVRATSEIWIDEVYVIMKIAPSDFHAKVR